MANLSSLPLAMGQLWCVFWGKPFWKFLHQGNSKNTCWVVTQPWTQGNRVDNIVPPPGKHISLVIRVPPPGKHISLAYSELCCSKWETHIPSDMCSPTRETHIPSDMCFPTAETHFHFLLVLEGEKKTLKEEREVHSTATKVGRLQLKFMDGKLFSIP